MPKTPLSRLLIKKFRSIIKLADLERENMEPETNQNQESLEDYLDRKKRKIILEYLKEKIPIFLEQGFHYDHFWGALEDHCLEEEIEGHPESHLTWRNSRTLFEQLVREAKTKGRELP